ncbi:MAG: L-serine ammonia-lyase [Planctomycetes bacterium]|nr:L-serine ammonia-lyase [Planctomycetota bacterium]
MSLRILDMFRIGPGPSSSHTVGPMRAAGRFRHHCLDRGIVPHRLQVELRGSLSATGHGHGTDRAVLAGLCGWEPETVDPDAFLAIADRLRAEPEIDWGGRRVRLHPDDVAFDRSRRTDPEWLPHPNTQVCRAFAGDGSLILEESWLSVGGGFVQRTGDEGGKRRPPSPPIAPFHDGRTLLEQARTFGSFGTVVLANERVWEEEPGLLETGLDRIWDAFRACIRRGLGRQGSLPGDLGVVRRAATLATQVDSGRVEESYRNIARAQAYAYAVNEENAAGGIVVTAPTNGAAGIFPAVVVEAAERLGLERVAIHRALATGAAIAMVIKTHASLSGAEVGCQGEVGSATAMAAAALCEILGGDVDQVERAAEIGLEHNLGLTCDPIKGLVQAPCIERNAMGVAKAWSAAQLALNTGGRGIVSLDKVIRVMKRTGDDMRREYKETSEGGLAVNLPEC